MCVCVLQAGQAHQSIDNAADDMKDVLQDLLQTMEEAASQAGVVSNMIDSISKAIARVSRPTVGNVAGGGLRGWGGSVSDMFGS